MKIGRVLPAPSGPIDVVGLGENSLDLVAVLDAFPTASAKMPIREWHRLPGGQVATAITALARLGFRTRYLGAFGDDDNGAEGLASLEREGVDTTFARRVRGAESRFALILVSEEGERTVLFRRPSGLVLTPDMLSAAAIDSARVLLVDAENVDASLRAVAMASAASIPVVVDVDSPGDGVDALLNQVDVIIAAEAFPRELTGLTDPSRALEAVARRYPRASVVCVTLGAAGSIARSAGRELRTPSFQVPCVDTTGAGDAFRAGFIARWLRDGNDAQLEDVLITANAVAALNCRALGARTALPTFPEVDALVSRSSSRRCADDGRVSSRQ